MQVPLVLLNLDDALGNGNNNPDELGIAVGHALSAACNNNDEETFAQRVRQITAAIIAAAEDDDAAD